VVFKEKYRLDQAQLEKYSHDLRPLDLGQENGRVWKSGLVGTKIARFGGGESIKRVTILDDV
jgi:hypothetical protein